MIFDVYKGLKDVIRVSLRIDSSLIDARALVGWCDESTGRSDRRVVVVLSWSPVYPIAWCFSRE